MADMKVNEHRPMLGNRHPNAERHDSPDSIRRGGGEDPRRYEAHILIDKVVRDHDMSGYNHNATSTQPANNGRENEVYAHEKNVKAMKMGTPLPDGLYHY